MQSRQLLRQEVRAKRKDLSSAEQQQASQYVLEHLKNTSVINSAQHIAIYLSHDGEINTAPIIQWLWQQNKSLYLPIIHPFRCGHLLFQSYTPETPLIPNQFGILEPKLNATEICPINQLDIILTPLVAFDDKGHRLGMGGGFYDRTFPHTKAIRMGIGHNCQYKPNLPKEDWDMPLHQMITPNKTWVFPSEIS